MLRRPSLICLLLSIAPICAAIAPCPSWALEHEDPRRRLDAALQLIRENRPKEAAPALAALGESGGDSEVAAESLFRAAQLYDEQLNAPAKAQPLFNETAQRYPESRFALRAQRRSQELSRLLGDVPAALIELNEIASAYQTLGMPAVITRLHQLLVAYPAFALADRATYLLGMAYRDSGQTRAAKQTLRKMLVDYPASAWAPYARQALGLLALQGGEYQEADRQFQQLLAYREPLWTTASREGLEACARALWRHRVAQLSWVYLSALIAYLAWRGRARLFPPPLEVAYYIPVGLFLVLVTVSRRSAPVSWAMLWLMLGGTVLTWVSASAGIMSFRAKPAPLLWGLVIRALAAVAIIYLSIYHSGLSNLIVETWRMGPQSG